VSKLPGVEKLAVLVSKVTGALLGAPFVPADRMIRGESICEQMVMVRVHADPAITVVLSVDAEAGRKLSAALFGRPEHEITLPLTDEGAASLLTSIAAQIARLLNVDHPAGAPRRTTLGQLVRENGALDFDEAILLRSRGGIDLGLWILEERSGNEPRPRGNRAIGRILRFLLRRIRPRRAGRSAERLEIRSMHDGKRWNEARSRANVATSRFGSRGRSAERAQLLHRAHEEHQRGRSVRRDTSPPPPG
jgi:hypothetical protein